MIIMTISLTFFLRSTGHICCVCCANKRVCRSTLIFVVLVINAGQKVSAALSPTLIKHRHLNRNRLSRIQQFRPPCQPRFAYLSIMTKKRSRLPVPFLKMNTLTTAWVSGMAFGLLSLMRLKTNLPPCQLKFPKIIRANLRFDHY